MVEALESHRRSGILFHPVSVPVGAELVPSMNLKFEA